MSSLGDPLGVALSVYEENIYNPGAQTSGFTRPQPPVGPQLENEATFSELPPYPSFEVSEAPMLKQSLAVAGGVMVVVPGPSFPLENITKKLGLAHIISSMSCE